MDREAVAALAVKGIGQIKVKGGGPIEETDHTA
jgi:hypothetical protein